MSTYRTPLSSISLFVLLDLLGASNPSVPSYYKTTHWAYQHLCTLETRLRALSRFRSSPNHPLKRRSIDASAHARSPPEEPTFLPDFHKFDDKPGRARPHEFLIEDDHVPFMRRGVEVLHVIPSTFPPVWHRLEDDGEHLDMDTVEDWAVLVSAFVAEWMDLEGFMDKVEDDGMERGGKRIGRRWEETVISKTEL